MIKFVTTVCTMSYKEMKPEKLFKLLQKQKHGYELYHADNMVKPHIDYDGICTIDECTDEYVENLQQQILKVASEVFKNDHWAISRDVRQKADGSMKVGFHFVLWDSKCTNHELKGFMKDNLHTFLDAGLPNTDLVVYRDHWNKWRVPMTSTEKTKQDPHSYLKMVNYDTIEDFDKHLVSYTTNCTIMELPKKPKKPKKPKLPKKPKKPKKSKLPKYIKKKSKSVEKHGKLFTNIEGSLCGENHSSNHNYIVQDGDRMEIRCHSEKCKDFSMLVDTGRFDPVVLHEIDGDDEDYKQLENIQKKIQDITNNEDLTKKAKKKQKKTMQTKCDRLQKQIADKKYIDRRKYFQQFHCKIQQPPVYVIHSGNKIGIYTVAKLKEMYADISGFINGIKFVHHGWIVDVYKRRYDTIDFLPPPNQCPATVFNTWQGFKIQREHTKRVNIDAIYEHIRLLVDRHVESYDYVLNYIAHLLQKPGELPLVSMLFVSDEQGVGKNLFWEWFLGRKIIGQEYILQTADLTKVIGRFNSNNNKLLVVMDETSGKNTFCENETIKNLITAETFEWEKKGIDGINIRNFGRYIWFSNNQTPLPIPAFDRRFVAFKCSGEMAQNQEYFANLMEVMKRGARAFYDDMMQRDISMFDPPNDRPITELYQDLQTVTIPRIAEFANDIVTYQMPAIGNNEPVPIHRMFALYNGWVESNGYKTNHQTLRKFAKTLSKYKGVIKKRTKYTRHFIIHFKELTEYLKEKKWYRDD